MNLITIVPKTANQLITRDPNFIWKWFIGLPNVFSPKKIKIITKLMCIFIFKKTKKWMRLIGIGMVRMSGPNIVTW